LIVIVIVNVFCWLEAATPKESFTTAKQPLKKNYVEYLLRLP
jgi:hypothetical protein